MFFNYNSLLFCDPDAMSEDGLNESEILDEDEVLGGEEEEGVSCKLNTYQHPLNRIYLLFQNY